MSRVRVAFGKRVPLIRNLTLAIVCYAIIPLFYKISSKETNPKKTEFNSPAPNKQQLNQKTTMLSEFILIGPWNVAIDKLEIVAIDAIIENDKVPAFSFDVHLRTGNVLSIGDFDKISEAITERNYLLEELDIDTEEEEEKDTIPKERRVISMYKTMEESWNEDRLTLFPDGEPTEADIDIDAPPIDAVFAESEEVDQEQDWQKVN